MCRILGILSPGIIRSEWILPFADLAVNGKLRADMTEKGHNDGWGMVSYLKEGTPQYLAREPHSVTKDPALFRSSVEKIESSGCRTALIHLRKSSIGEHTVANTHPFISGPWAFGHNGDVLGTERMNFKKLKPQGTGDSERLFLYLAERLPAGADADTQRDALQNAVAELKKDFKYDSVTCVLTDGKVMHALRDCIQKDEGYYTLFSARVDGAAIFCSEPIPAITPEWTAVPNGSLITAAL